MKRLSRILCIFLTVLTLLSTLAVAFQGASVFQRQKKSIYLVLDDSSSMAVRPTLDANYSLQSLLAMTDKNDEVKLYFLNENRSISGNIDMSKKDNIMLSDICGNYPPPSGSTPYGNVSTAQNELKAAAYKGDETEYWLVVFTDGTFDEYPPDPEVIVDPNDPNKIIYKNSALSSELQKFAKTKLNNGSYPNVLYITVGGAEVDAGGLSNLHPISGTSVIDTMNEAAKIISGRINIDNVSYSAGNSELSFTLPYPAKNIIVFTQNNETKITSSKSTSDLNISENYTITYPDLGYEIDKSTVCFLTEKNNSSIASGDITLTFDKSLDPQNTTVLFEPAIGMTAHYYNSDGAEVDPQDLCIGEQCRVEFSICDSETKQLLDSSILGGDVKYYSEIDGDRADSNVRDFTINGDKVEIILYAELPDGYVLDIVNTYDNLKEKRNITFMLSNGGHFKADIRDLKKAEGIYAEILKNGINLTAEELKSFDLKVKGQNGYASRFAIEADEQNGRFVIHPKKGWISPLTPKNKTYEVVLTDKKTGDKYTADLVVEITGPRSWLPVILELLAIYILLTIIFQTRFPRKLRFSLYIDEPPSPDEELSDVNMSLAFMYWKEFLHIFRGRPDFILHLLQRFYPGGKARVTLFGAEEGSGAYSDITLYPVSGNKVLAKDENMKKLEDSSWDSDFAVADSDFIPYLYATDLLNEGNGKKPKFEITLGNVLVKYDTSDNTVYYLQITRDKQNHIL